MAEKWNDAEVLAKVKAGAMKGIVRATEIVRNEMIVSITDGQKTGRVYKRGAVEHQASAPGEAPASDTGQLVNSITTEYDEEALVGKIGVHTGYAGFLEFGTQKMAPRPFARAALSNKADEITEIVLFEIDAAL
jgi:HK97 gp10 family phage protein